MNYSVGSHPRGVAIRLIASRNKKFYFGICFGSVGYLARLQTLPFSLSIHHVTHHFIKIL